MPAHADTNVVSLAAFRAGSNTATQSANALKSGQFVEWPAEAEGNNKTNENSDVSAACRVSNYVQSDKKCRVVSNVSSTVETAGGADRKPAIAVSFHEANATPDQIRRDIAERRKELPTLYPANYAAWEWMNRRGIDLTAQVHRPWQGGRGRKGFANFLRDMADVGIKTREGDTLNRHDTFNPLYAPGLVSFADHKEQANNTPRNRLVWDPAIGDYTTATLAAERHGLKPGTILKALERKGDPRTVISSRLKGPKISARGKVVMKPPEAEEDTKPIPPQPIPQSGDPTTRWPWTLTGAQRDGWNKRYLGNRKADPQNGRFPWRHEWALRFLEAEILGAGYGLPGRQGSLDGRLAKMRASWRNEEPTDAQWADYCKVEAYYQKCIERRAELLAKLPEIRASLAGKERDKDPEHQKSFRHYHESVE